MPHSRKGVPIFVDMLIARWHALRRGDVVIFLVAAFLIVAVVAVEFLFFENQGLFLVFQKQGFGPDWECSNPGYGGPICVKKPAPSR